jgi:hypothetical protein
MLAAFDLYDTVLAGLGIFNCLPGLSQAKELRTHTPTSD